MKRILFISLFFLCFTSCAPRVIKDIAIKYPPLDNTSEVSVFEIGDDVPENAEVLGGIAILEGFAARNWEHLLEKAKKEVRAVGGNGLEIQTHIYPYSDGNNYHQIAAYILDIDNNYKPAEPAVIIDEVFNDYVVMHEDDTIPCIIADESDASILFVYDYERQGNRRTVWIPKDDLVSYHIEDTASLVVTQQGKRKPITTRFAIVGGYCPTFKGFAYAGKVNLITKSMALGVTYNRFFGNRSENIQNHIIAGSIGYRKDFLSNQKLLDCLLDGACNLHKLNDQNQWFTFELLFGCEILKNKVYPLTGCDITYDLMLTKHLGFDVGASLYISNQTLPYLYAGLFYCL